MNLKLLKAFITIADTESFSKAAERLFISQPALSQNIKQLESHFGVNLIKRDPHNFFLTEAGKVLYEYAVNLLEASDLMEEAMDSFRSSLGDKLRVGATSVIGGYAVPCSIFMFKKKHPDAIITLKLGNRCQILDQLREDLIDVAIVEGDKPEDSFVSAEIHTEEMVMVAPYTEQWKASGHLRLDDLAKVPLIMREKESATRCTVEGTLRKSGISLQNLNVVMELDSVDSIKAAVEVICYPQIGQ